MIGRRQLAVASPISIAAVARAFAGSALASYEQHHVARALVEHRYAAARAYLTDSGTSALVLALRAAVPPGGVVGFPGYSCVDLAAAALRAGVRVRLYDLDPATLGPDLDSIDALLRRGVDALVVAHLYGYPADVPAVRERASRAGVVVIEDAAQGAGGALAGQRLGTLGDLSILSFGRGKGLCAGGGGALLSRDGRFTQALDRVKLRPSGRGWLGLAKTTVQWALGRPSVYAIPSSIPWLHLGEMVYRSAGEPARLPSGAASLIQSAFALDDLTASRRREVARVLDAAARAARGIGVSDLIREADGGYLRYAVRDLTGGRTMDRALGVLRAYPHTLAEQRELAPVLVPGEPATPGATELRRTLFTLPTHHFVSASDRTAMVEWMRVD